MLKLLKPFATAILVAGAFAITAGPAAAQHHGWHGHGGGHWHHGWRGRGGWGGDWGFSAPWAYGNYRYYTDPYYARPVCGWVHVRGWRRAVWRCW